MKRLFCAIYSVSLGGILLLTGYFGVISMAAQSEQLAIPTVNGVVSGLAAFNASRATTVDEFGENINYTQTRIYTFKAKHSGLCLDIEESSLDDGTKIIQWNCHGGDNQKWLFVSDGNGYYQIKAKHSGKCVDESLTDNGATVSQYGCHNGGNQKWQLIKDKKGYYQIKSKQSKMCLDVEESSNEDGARVISFGCHTGDNQKWQLTMAKTSSKK
jgi:hypothetical protein